MQKLTRRSFTLGSIASCMGAAAHAFAGEKAGASCDYRPPNLILLLADDYRWDCLGCMGNGIIQTPNLDAMAGEGVLFENAYVTTSICAPSRATIFSGQYVCRHGINNFNTSFTPAQLDDTYPARLRASGYTTGFIGKYGVGERMPEQAFDYWRGFGGQGHYEQKDGRGEYRHLTGLQQDQALEFLETAGSREPFCLSVSCTAPHCQDGDPRQFIYDPVYESLYRDTQIPQPEYLRDNYLERFPDFFRHDNEARRRWKLRFSSPELFQEMVKSYYRLITGIDDAVGAIRKKLAETALDDNTIVLFTADNGFFLGDHGLAGKWFGYEASIRVPFIVFDPRLPEERHGARLSHIVLNVDIAPSLLGLAGITPPNAMQGRDITPLLQGKDISWRKDFFYEHTFEHPGIPKSEGVISAEYKYLRYIDQNPAHEELFDLRSDRHETINLASDPERRDLLDKMRLRYSELKNAVCQ